MKKLLTLLMILALAIPAWAGTQTITISRNDGDFESSTGVYYASKGGVTMTMSGGLNNKNYLVLRHENTITFKSANFAIKEIVFHCLDNFLEGNNDVFYWGPTTMNVMTVNYKPIGSNQTQAITPGKYTASGYDGHWTSNYSGTWTSTFKGVTRTHTKFADGYPAGNTLTFESMGKPIRFSSIDIIVEKEDGDIYDLVTSDDQVVNQHNYIIVNWQNAKALSVNTTEGKVNEQVRTGSPVEFISGHVDDSGNYDQYAKVKTDGEAQIIKFEKRSLPISDSNGQINNDRPWLLNAGGNYMRITSSANSSPDGNIGPDLYGVSTINDEWSYAKIEIGGQSYGYNARIRFRKMSSTNYPRPTDTQYRVAYNKTNNYFRDLDYANYTNYANQNIRLYTPAQNYDVTTEVQPDASKGTIALRDGVIVNDASATSGTSQQYEVVSFMVTAANGYKIANLTIEELNPDGTLASTIEPTSSIHTTNGTLYTFTMPANDVHIIATFEEVEYHNIYIDVKPNVNYGNVFLTDGYVVQNDQVKSYEGENVVFNIVANPKDPDQPNGALYELYSVTVTYYENGQEISYTYTDGNYNFTMPDADVKITATFIYEADGVGPLYLLGTASGETEWHPYGPRFNYDPNEGQYYLDVYFKGVGEFGDTENKDEYGYFSLVWKKGNTWEEINNQGVRGVPWDDNTLAGPGHDQQLHYSDEGASEMNHYKIPAGIYRFYVKSYGYHNDWLYVTKYDTNLTLDPMGGETAETAQYVSDGTEVLMEGDIYNKIMAINPDEPAVNFKYKALKNGTADAPVQSTTTATTTLNKDANQDETTIELNGYNYLGWIVADNTAYYKVIETPLSWIEENGELGKTYTVSDELVIVHIINRTEFESGSGDYYPEQRLIWAKDQGNRSICPTSIKDGQVDYVRDMLHMQNGDWDQSNWVMLKFPDGTDLEDETLGYAIGNTIKAGTLKGFYIDDQNYCIEVESMEIGDNIVDYQPNMFCTANFLDANLNLDGEEGSAVGPTGTHYFFMNPKVQEVADVIAAVWNGEYFVVATQGNGQNAADLDGAFTVDWEYNKNYDVSGSLTTGQAYVFRGVLNLKSIKGLVQGKDVTPDDYKNVMPFNLDDSTITSVNDIDANKTVSSVKYYNITGMESNKPFDGVNIVVTRYTDGTFTTSKVLR